MDEQVVLAVTTFPDMDTARNIGTRLVESQRVSCVNLLPGAESIYRWEGKLEQSREVLALLKLPLHAVPALQLELARMHPYDCPELLVFPASGGLPAYLDWVRAQTPAP